jgi:uncharacterized protein YcgI (DUF1989 family)
MNLEMKRVLCWLPVAMALVVVLSACPGGPSQAPPTAAQP